MDGSNRSGLFVAPIIKIPLLGALSICANNYETIRSITWLESELCPLLGMSASSSSINTMHGLLATAL